MTQDAYSAQLVMELKNISKSLGRIAVSLEKLTNDTQKPGNLRHLESTLSDLRTAIDRK